MFKEVGEVLKSDGQALMTKIVDSINNNSSNIKIEELKMEILMCMDIFLEASELFYKDNFFTQVSMYYVIVLIIQLYHHPS